MLLNSKNTNPPKRRKTKVSRAKKPKKTKGGSVYAKMIADPCNSTLQPGIYGSQYGMLTRNVQRTIPSPGTFSSGANATSGYVVWFPSAHCNAASGVSGHVNCFFYGNNNADAGPTLNSFGCESSATNATAKSIADPSYNFMSSESAMDARTLSACLRTTYTGTTSAARGVIMPLVNIPISALLYGDTGTNPASISNLSRYSTRQFRAVDTVEVLHRPSTSDFLRENIGCISATVGSPPTFAEYSERTNVLGIGFVFYNVTAMSDYVFNFYKNIEWRPEPFSGFANVVPRGIDNPNTLSRALAYLDSVMPNWQSRLADGATQQFITSLTRSVFGGSMAQLATSAAMRNAIEL